MACSVSLENTDVIVYIFKRKSLIKIPSTSVIYPVTIMVTGFLLFIGILKPIIVDEVFGY